MQVNQSTQQKRLLHSNISKCETVIYLQIDIVMKLDYKKSRKRLIIYNTIVKCKNSIIWLDDLSTHKNV